MPPVQQVQLWSCLTAKYSTVGGIVSGSNWEMTATQSQSGVSWCGDTACAELPSISHSEQCFMEWLSIAQQLHPQCYVSWLDSRAVEMFSAVPITRLLSGQQMSLGLTVAKRRLAVWLHCAKCEVCWKVDYGVALFIRSCGAIQYNLSEMSQEFSGSVPEHTNVLLEEWSEMSNNTPKPRGKPSQKSLKLI